jgi:hypothetical protein
VQLDDGGSAKISTTVSSKCTRSRCDGCMAEADCWSPKVKGGTSVQTEKSLVGPLGPQDWVIKDQFAIAPISARILWVSLS